MKSRLQRKKGLIECIESVGFVSRHGSSARYFEDGLMVAIDVYSHSHADSLWMDVGFGPAGFFSKKGVAFYQLPVIARVDSVFDEFRQEILSMLGHFDDEDMAADTQVALLEKIIPGLLACSRKEGLRSLFKDGRFAQARDLSGWLTSATS